MRARLVRSGPQGNGHNSPMSHRGYGTSFFLAGLGGGWWLAAGCVLLAACSPALNWRELGFEGSGARASLPCKPDRTTRTVPLGGQPLELHMAGCEADGAMLAVMWARLPAGTDAQGALAGWQQATLANMQAPAGAVHRTPFALARALNLPGAMRVQATGLRPDGAPVQAQAVWTAAATPQGVELMHAVLYAPPAQGRAQARRAEAAQALFDGLRWP